MTGRQLIMYILQHDLEDKDVIQDGVFVGFMTRIEAAEKFDVGIATIQAWLNEGWLDGYRLDEVVIIPKNANKPKQLGTE